jgi:hypothetical protein
MLYIDKDVEPIGDVIAGRGYEMEAYLHEL